MKPAQFLFEHTVLTATPRLDGAMRLKDRLDSRAHPQIEVVLPSGTDALVNLDGVLAVGLPDAGGGADPSRWGHRYPKTTRVSIGPYLVEGTAHLWPGLGVEGWFHQEGRFLSLTHAVAQRDRHRVSYGVVFVARVLVNYMSWDADDHAAVPAPA